MIAPPGNFRIFLSPLPVDFRKGMGGLSGYIAAEIDPDPFSEAI